VCHRSNAKYLGATRSDVRAVKKAKVATVPIFTLLVIAGCANPRPELSLPTTPSITAKPISSPTLIETVRPAPSGTTTAQFLINQVGENYFREHYTLVHEEIVVAGVIKAAYRYTYEP
jgi:hypothetical protein